MTKETKSAAIFIRVTPEVKELAEKLAKEDSRSLSSYIEQLILKDSRSK